MSVRRSQLRPGQRTLRCRLYPRRPPLEIPRSTGTHPPRTTADFFSRRYVQMYQNASLLAAFPLIHHSNTGRSGRSWIRGPIVGVRVRDPRPGGTVDKIRITARNHAYSHGLQSTIGRGVSCIVIAVTPQPASETTRPAIRRSEGELRGFVRRATINLLTSVIAVAISGCLGPPVLERQVLGYDEVTRTLDEKLLLLNIARVSNQEPVHFTSTSSIAATFNWTTTLGASGEIAQSKGTNFLNLNIGGSASENPTFSISPISGKEFTERVATPFQDRVFEFLVFQGGRIDQAMRLMGAGIEVQKPDGRFVRFIENDPRRPKEYEEFRRIAAHLQWLNDNRQLFVRPLVFDEPLIADFKNTPSAGDINNGFNMGLRWRQKPNGHYELTRLKGDRVVVGNFDPMALTDQQRFELDEKIKKNPSGFVYLDIRPNGPGGNFPIQGAIKLRACFRFLILSPQASGLPRSS